MLNVRPILAPAAVSKMPRSGTGGVPLGCFVKEAAFSVLFGWVGSLLAYKTTAYGSESHEKVLPCIVIECGYDGSPWKVCNNPKETHHDLTI